MMIDPYASGVLDPAVHDRLVADIFNAAQDANIPVQWIRTPIQDGCGPQEVEWVERFHSHTPAGSAGLCMTGSKMNILPEVRMLAIAGALTRNFLRARVMTVNELLAAARDGDVPRMSCLLVPNFFVEKGKVGANGQWRSEALLDALVIRHTAGQQTVLHVASMAEMALDYGLAMRRHIERLYEIVEVV